MIRNYLKIAFRNLVRNKVYSFINIVGLAVGLVVTMLIFLFVSHEAAYDQFQVNGDRIFKVSANVKYGDQEVHFTAIPAKLAPTVKANNPHILNYVRMNGSGGVVMKNPLNPAQKFKEDSFSFVDASFFTVFSFQLKTGEVSQAFKNPFSLVISEKAAKKYFGTENPIGKTLLYDNKNTFTITGILADAPSNSSLSFDFLSPIETYPKMGKSQQETWEKSGAFETYLLLDTEQSVAKVEKSIAQSSEKRGIFDKGTTYQLSQYSSQHLGGGFSNNTNARYVYIFSGIALLILFLALFNYMSLTTARATLRAKEVGIRKVAGAGRGGLIQQFYIESIFICSLAFALAFLLLELVRQPFYDLMGIQIDDSFLVNPLFIGIVLATFVSSAFLAGSYPALLLSKFAPIEVIKGKFTSGQGGARVRKGFMIFQFTVSVVLIVCSLVIQKQVSYMKNKDIGFVKDQVLAVPMDASLANNYLSLKSEIKQMSGVKAITSVTVPLFKGFNAWFMKSLKSKKDVMLAFMNTDEAFFKTISLRWAIAPANTANMASKIYVNELAVQQMELGKDPVGKFIDLGIRKVEVGGVLKNFHFTNVQQKIDPMMIMVYGNDSKDWAMANGNPTLYIRFEPNVLLQEKLANTKYIFEKYQSEKPFEYYFLDEAFNKTFATEMRLSSLFSWFTGFAIFIACMGLFGLVTFAAETRTKEIGIRKVLGASVSNIVALLSTDFMKLILISLFIAFPAAWWAMNRWLEEFAYKTDLSWWTFALAGVSAIVIALLTVSYQAIRAALMNPVKSLKNE